MWALSIMQPYATLIIGGEKKVETRAYPVPNGYRGRIAIHASSTYRGEDRAICLREPFASALIRCGVPKVKAFTGELPNRDALPRGVILGTADLYDCRKVTGDEPHYVWHLSEQEQEFGFFERGRFAWFLRDIERFPEPIRASGQLGLWPWMEAMR